MQEHGKPRGSLDERADRRAVESKDQVALPVARHGAILDLGGSFADQQARA
jgi:hypothetical protein